MIDIEKLQQRKIKAFNRLLKDKNIESILFENEYWCITYKSKQVFRCRGYIVDSALICERDKPKFLKKKN